MNTLKIGALWGLPALEHFSVCAYIYKRTTLKSIMAQYPTLKLIMAPFSGPTQPYKTNTLATFHVISRLVLLDWTDHSLLPTLAQNLRGLNIGLFFYVPRRPELLGEMKNTQMVFSQGQFVRVTFFLILPMTGLHTSL